VEDIDSCGCKKPRAHVVIDGHPYTVVPVDPDDAPTCQGCSKTYLGPWRAGQALTSNPDLCGHPRKSGGPCGWRILDEPCPYHLTPQQKEEARIAAQERKAREAAAAEQRRVEANLRAEQNRQQLVLVFSVACPHCSAPAGTVCTTPKGNRQRDIHLRRRHLAGVRRPKQLLLYERSVWLTDPTPEPPALDGDLRALLGDPLHDRTAQAMVRYEADLAEREAERARRAEADIQELRANVLELINS
jgi:hypothetical protein